ncbi:MAG: DUF4166 domain-containing protein [Proteobacteria bacterium]|nr:DUF4166 domain-containing protein [Pseudomonadota bacterium]
MADLPTPVRHVHTLADPLRLTGRADVTRAPTLAARILCAIASLPRPGTDVPVTVTFTPLPDGHERWLRIFDVLPYASIMSAGVGRDAGLLHERFGPFGFLTLLFRLEPTPAGLTWKVVRWRLLGIPMPAATVPKIDCLESETPSPDGPRYRFDIDVAFPIAGPVISYSGWLAVEPPVQISPEWNSPPNAANTPASTSPGGHSREIP